ncbi:MAG: amino acid ABC transporter permease [Acidimicrobiales bacterium]
MSLGTDEGSTTPNLFAPRHRRILVGRRGLAASTISSVVLLGALVALFFFAPGSATVRYYYFNGHNMWQSFVGHPQTGLLSVGRGFVTNIWMCLLCEVLILFFGLGVAWVRVSRSAVLVPFRVLATAYTDIFRGVPLLLVVFLVGFGLPALGLGVLSSQSPDVYGCVALTLTYSAYVAEVFRAGIYSVPNGQILAARSLGLTHGTIMRRVTLPQAVRTVIPPLLNDFISLQKDTALVSVLGAIEAARAAQIYESTVFNGSGLVVASLLFLAITIPLTRFTDRLLDRDRRRRLASLS